MTVEDDELSAEDKAAEAAMLDAFAEPAPPKPASVAAEKPADAAEKPVVEKPPVQTPAETPFVVTREQWDAAMKKLTSFETQFPKVNGTLGNLQQLVNQLRSATPQGVQIELPPELEQDFPEIAAHLKKAKLRGTATAPASEVKPSITDEEIRTLIGEARDEAQKTIDVKLREARQRVEAEALDDLHPDWRGIVGASATPDQNLPYRKWLATQTASYQQLVNETDSASVIARSIERFKAATKAQPANGKPATVVPDRRRAAIQPKGDGGQPDASTNSERDAFTKAFAS
jgi:hypothetical protein